MHKTFTINNNFKWVENLKSFLDFYNRRRHRTIGLAPIEVTRANEKELYKKVYEQRDRPIVAKTIKYPLGTYVRISKHKNLFEKSYSGNFSSEVFRVVRVNRVVPVTYYLQDYLGEEILGCFYADELTRVEANPKSYLVEKILRRKGRKVYVKYLGLDKAFNAWIDESAVI